MSTTDNQIKNEPCKHTDLHPDTRCKNCDVVLNSYLFSVYHGLTYLR